MSAAPNTAASPTRASDATQPRQYTPGLSDAIGDRLLTFDAATASSIELLRFKPEFANAPGFEAALRKRLETLARVRHPSLAVVRGLETTNEGVALSSTHTAGRRLSEILIDARGAAFALELVRQVAPALAALHQAGPDVAHGVLSPERIVVTREGRLVVVEQVLGSAVQALKLSATQLRSTLGVAIHAAGETAALDQRSDVIQLGLIALSLLVGRRIEASDYPASVPTLLDAFAKADPVAGVRLRPWLERALQLGERPFANALEASQAFSEVPDEPAAPAPEPARQVLTFHKPADGPTPSVLARPTIEPVAATPAVHAVEPTVTAPNRTKKFVMWGLAAVALVAAAEGLVIAGFYLTGLADEQAAVVVAPPPTRTEVAAGIPQPAAVPIPESTSTASADVNAAAIATIPRPTGTSDTGTPASTDPAAAAPAGASRFGGIRFTAPFEIQAFDGERLIGSTAGPIAIVEGSHVIDLVNEELGYRARQTVVVRAGQMAAVTVAVPNGRLSINAVPWAEVLIDGTAAGETPLANLSIPIGRHEITFRHPQLGEQKQTVIVKAEGLTRASATFQR